MTGSALPSSDYYVSVQGGEDIGAYPNLNCAILVAVGHSWTTPRPVRVYTRIDNRPGLCVAWADHGDVRIVGCREG